MVGREVAKLIHDTNDDICAAHSEIATQMKQRQQGQVTNRHKPDGDKQTEREGKGRYRERRCDTRRCIGWL